MTETAPCLHPRSSAIGNTYSEDSILLWCPDCGGVARADGAALEVKDTVSVLTPKADAWQFAQDADLRCALEALISDLEDADVDVDGAAPELLATVNIARGLLAKRGRR